MGAPALIALDWGTTRLRAALLDRDGMALQTREAASGVGADTPEGMAARFDEAVQGWPVLPAIAAGMVGSRQGWHEADYLPCPADLAALGGALTRFDHGARPVAIVPGLCVDRGQEDTGRADVMRGEETQIAGLVASGTRSATVVLPGTHSKWVRLDDAVVRDFHTFMTGETFAALRDHTVLRHTLHAERDINETIFADAVLQASADPTTIVSGPFGLRAQALVSGAVEAPESRLSGWLVGAEFAAARSCGYDAPSVEIIGTARLADLYRLAARRLGLSVNAHDGGDLVWPALLAIAREADLVAGERAA